MFAALVSAVIVASRLPLGALFKTIIPIYLIVVISVACNSFAYADGSLGFSLAGLSRGCLFGIRIILLALASMIVCFTTTSDQLQLAIAWFLRLFGGKGRIADDISMVLSIAIRFIPLIAQEFLSIKAAQWSRGATFDEGNLFKRLQAHCLVLMPMLVGLFRKADALSLALDARCYGMPGVMRTSMTTLQQGWIWLVQATSISAILIAIALVG